MRPDHRRTDVVLVAGKMPGLQTTGRSLGTSFEDLMIKPALEGLVTIKALSTAGFLKIYKKAGKLLFAVAVHFDDNCCAVFDDPSLGEFEEKRKTRQREAQADCRAACRVIRSPGGGALRVAR